MMKAMLWAVQKARSNALEACQDDEGLAELLNPWLFSDDCQQLMTRMSDKAQPDPMDVMNCMGVLNRYGGNGVSMTLAVAGSQFPNVRRRLTADSPIEAIKVHEPVDGSNAASSP